MDFKEVITARYSCKKFSDKQVGKEQLEAILDAGRLAPTAKNLQEQRIYVLQSPEALEKIDAVTPCRYGAPTVLVVAFNSKNVFTYPGGKRDSGVEDASIVATHMILAAADEGVDSCWLNFFDPDAAAKIAELADGGMRDALSLLDICRSSDETVTAETVSRCAGLAGREYLFELTDKIALNDISAVLETVDKLYEGSADVSRICDELINHFRNLMIVSCTKDASAILKLMPGELLRTEKQAKEFSQAEIFHAVSVLQDTLVKMSKSASKRLEFELALVKLCSPALSQSQEALISRIEKLEKEIVLLKARGVAAAVPSVQPEPVPIAEPLTREEPSPVYGEILPEEPKPIFEPAGNSEPVFENWEEAVEIIRGKNSMLYSFLKDSKAYLINGRVLIDSSNDCFIDYMQKTADAKEVIKN